ncbi:hypothetical protein G3D11_002949 [Salmonella enterica]|nr:hypothetical protein [Salmonella enterica]
MPAFEWVHVQLHQQKGMISLSPPTICNSATKTDLVLNTIEGAIASLGEQVVNELGDFHHVNRVYVVGGGAPLIYDSIKTAWHHLGQKVVMMESPQTALVEAIAAFKEE